MPPCPQYEATQISTVRIAGRPVKGGTYGCEQVRTLKTEAEEMQLIRTTAGKAMQNLSPPHVPTPF